MKLWSNIAGQALSIWEGMAGASGPRRVERAKLVPLHVASSVALTVAAFLLMLVNGLALSFVLPVVAGIFALAITLCMILQELRPDAQPLPAGRPEPQAGPEFLEMIPGLVTRHDSAGQILSAGGADRRLFGFGGRRPEPSSYIDAIHVGGRIGFLTAVDELRQGAPRAEAEFLFACASSAAGYRPVRAVLVAEPRIDGEFCGFVAHTSDHCEVAALRADVATWKCEAHSAHDAKTRFLAAVSHELRTPLNAILGFSDILIGEYFGAFQNDRQREYVALINQSGHHLLAVVTTMLDMSKIEAGRFELIKEPFRIAEAVRTVDEMLGLQARSKGVVLTTRVARDLDEVVADRRAMQQILINLAGNAIKFTAEGGVVAIDAVADSRSLIITVSDTGIGIPSDKLAMIGRPFMQVQSDLARRYEGTGLGLALVKGLVALHGGTFDIESEEGLGTVITVTVPMNGDGDAGAETFEFPPRLKEKTQETDTGENRHGAAQAKIA